MVAAIQYDKEEEGDLAEAADWARPRRRRVESVLVAGERQTPPHQSEENGGFR